MAELSSSTVHELVATHGLNETELSMEVTDDLFAHIVNDMDHWRGIAPHLGLNPAAREVIEEKPTVCEQRMFMLEVWKQKAGREATFFKLVKSFFNAERLDLADMVCKFFLKKAEQKRIEESEAYHTAQSYSTSLPTANHDMGRRETTFSIIPPPTQRSEVQDDEHSPLIQQQPPAKTALGMPCWCNGVLITTLVLCCVLAYGAICMLVLSDKIYNTNKIPPTERIYIDKEFVVQVREFDPFYVSDVTYTLEFGNTFLYKVPCQNRTVQNRTIDHHDKFDITQKPTYAISELYLVEDSYLNISFEMNLTNQSNPTPECLAVLCTFDNIDKYTRFLQREESPDTGDKYCLQNESESLYPLTADQSRYYFIGIYFPDVSLVESVEFEITGNEHYFNVPRGHPSDCALHPNSRPHCHLDFKGRYHWPDSRNNVCVLGTTPDNSSKFMYEAKSSDTVRQTHMILTILGSSGLILSYGIAVIVITSYLGIVLMRKTWLNAESLESEP